MTTQVADLTQALIVAEGDVKLVAEVLGVSEREVEHHYVLHAKDVSAGLMDGLTARTIAELISRLGDMSDGTLLKLLEILKGNLTVNLTQNNQQNNVFSTTDAIARLAQRMGINASSQ